MTCRTASGLALIDNFEQEGHLPLTDAALNDLCEQLLYLRAELPPPEWRALCREPFPEWISLLERRNCLIYLENWEQTLPSVAAMSALKPFLTTEIHETIRLAPGANILGLGRSALAAEGFWPHMSFAYLSSIAEMLRRAPLPEFDLVYTFEWLNLCTDAEAAVWLNAAVGMLRKGGRLIAANLAPGGRDAAYLEARWNLRPIYRDEQDLAHLASRLAGGFLCGHAVFRDDSGAMTFLEIQAA